MKKFLIVFSASIFIFITTLFASNYYWVGGTGNWSDYATHWATSSGGTVFHVTIPGPADNVFFDANSFPTFGDTTNLDTTTVNCNNMDWTGAANTPRLSGSATLKIYGSLTLIPAMICSPYIHLQATSTGNTITTAGHMCNGLAVNGTGEWTLMDSLKTYSFSMQSGVFNSNDQAIDCGNAFTCFGPLAQTLNLGSSVINVGGTDWQMGNSSNLILDADSTTINMITNAGAIFYGGSYTYHNLLITGNGVIYGNNTFNKVVANSTMTIEGNNSFDTLYFNSTGKTITLSSTDTQTIVDTLALNGTCTGLTVLKSSSASQPATIFKAAGSITLSYLLMSDIYTSGAATFTAYNSVPLSNVSGWIIPAAIPLNLYWIGGSGSWDDISHWALSSGGAGGNCIPTPYDNVFFDSNSFTGVNDTVTTAGQAVYCNNMDWTGAANTPRLSGSATLKIYGSLTLIPAMICSPYIHLQATSTGNTITSAGHMCNGLAVNGTGEWTLMDSLKTYSFSMQSGVFNSNDQAIDCGNAFTCFGPLAQTLNLGSSVINVGGTDWQMGNSSNLILDADSTTINMITNAGAIFYGGSYTYHNLLITGNGVIYGNNTFNKVVANSTMTIEGNNSFDTLYFNSTGKTITLSSTDTQTIVDTLALNGTCTGLTVLKSSSASQPATIFKAAGSITLSYLLMSDIYTSGAATFTAYNSVPLSNVSGWIIPAAIPLNLYWIGGSGSWDDISHWALSSGGAGGNCIPTPYDNVFFDSNSFTGVNDTVTTAGQAVYCNNMDWTGAANTPRLSGSATLKIYGSLTLIPAMICSPYIHLQATSTGNTITTAGHMCNGLAVNGTGEWTLMDSLKTYSFSMQSGVFNSNDQAIDCGNAFTCFGPLAQTLNLGSSVINVGGTDWQMGNSSNLILDADSTTINMITNAGAIFYGGSYTYHNLLITGNGVIYGNNIFTKVIANNDLTISGNNTTDTLLMPSPGQILNLDPSTVTVINNLINVLSDPGFPTTIKSNTGSAYLSQPTGNVCLDYVYIKNIATSGLATFYAGDHSVDLGGNSGWNWIRCAPLISNVWPGDCNYDLITDNFDLLNIGVAYGDTGYVRPGASLAYTAQPCQDWYYQFINAVNVKHADCDGNGIVDGPDSTAISLNYGQTHPARLAHQDESNTVGAELAFDIPPAVVPGSAVSVPINLGTSVDPAGNVYGIAFTIDYDPAFIQAGTMSVDYSGSWVENSSNHLHLEKDFPGAGKTDIAFTRIDHSDISGYGMIATLNFVVSPNADGPFSMSFSHVKVISHNEIEVPIQTNSGNTYVGIEENAGNIPSVVFPNPMTDQTQIFFSNPGHEQWTLTLKDITGRILDSEKTTTENIFLLERKNLTRGLYFYMIHNSEGKTSEGKIVVK